MILIHLRVLFGSDVKRWETLLVTNRASRAKLLSYIGFMAGNYAACGDHVASQCVAVSAIWLPK